MAIAAYRSGDALAALDAIADAVALSAPAGALRSLMDEGQPLREVLQLGMKRIPSFRAAGLHHDFVAQLVSGDQETEIDLRKVETARRAPQLSNREAEVARLLCSGRSNRDMAECLAMSTDTVKWHLKNIFGKLSVTNRTEAVLRLQQLGIVAEWTALPSPSPTVTSRLNAAE